MNEQQIRVELETKGIESAQAEEIISAFNKKTNDKTLLRGFILLGFGALLGFISCIFTILDLSHAFRDFVLYGLTCLSVGIVFCGLYLVFEKPASEVDKQP